MKEPVQCPTCGSMVDENEIGSMTVVEEVVGDSPEPVCIFELHQCEMCTNPVLLKVEPAPYGMEDEIVYPPPPRSKIFFYHSEIPNLVKDDLEESDTCFRYRLWNAFAAMARRTVHAVCAEIGVSAGDLHAQIEEVRNAGVFTKDQSDWAHAIRELGRNAAHPEWEIVTEGQAKAAKELLERLIMEVFELGKPRTPEWKGETKKRYRLF